jgi:hypothetical protein
MTCRARFTPAEGLLGFLRLTGRLTGATSVSLSGVALVAAVVVGSREAGQVVASM